jgi:hypothetical protein
MTFDERIKKNEWEDTDKCAHSGAYKRRRIYTGMKTLTPGMVFSFCLNNEHLFISWIGIQVCTLHRLSV